jgi:hypothetical protein
MDEDIRAAVERLRTAGEGPWYAARCERLLHRRGELEAVVSATGLPFRTNTKVRSPAVSIDVGPLRRSAGNVEFEYWLELRLSALYDIMFGRSTVRTGNLAAGRGGDPFIRWSRLAAPIEPFEAAVRAVEQLGLRVMSADEAFEHCPGLAFDHRSSFRGSVNTYWALTTDLNGWLDDPAAPPSRWTRVPRELEEIAASVRAFYEREHAALGSRAAAESPWLAVAASHLESVPGARAVERLEADPYPARGWTVDFGEVDHGSFRGRFCTDIFISRLAPVWYVTSRFSLVHPVFDARITELTGWTNAELGYLPPQTDLLFRLREQLLAAGCEELDEWQLSSSLPLHAGDRADIPERYASVKDLLFRDPLRLYAPAPAMDEERSHRELGTRRWVTRS